MVVRIKRSLLLSIALLALLGGCNTVPGPEKVEDTRLDELVSDMDQSLANQATVNAQLQEQRQQLALQQENLESMRLELGKALAKSDVTQCPEVAACPELPKTSNKMVVGALEKVWLTDLKLALTARIDTGAQTSSLDAGKIEMFERDGNRWVRFEIMNPATGKPRSLERKLKRTVAIQQAGAAQAKRRPVIKMGIIIGRANHTAEFTLSDRRHQSYQVLIGRNILQDVMVVDVSQKNVAPFILPDNKPNGKQAAR